MKNALLMIFAALVLTACPAKQELSSNTDGDALPGIWLRPASDGGMEGFALRQDGSLKMVGIYARKGVSWRQVGNDVVLASKVNWMDSVEKQQLRVEVADQNTLRLAAPGEFFAGEYSRFTPEKFAVDSARLHGNISGFSVDRLPKDAELYIELADVSSNKSRIVSSTSVNGLNSAPMAFEMYFDPSQIDADNSYVVRARIIDGRKTLMMNLNLVEVLTNGNGNQVSVKVTRI